MEANARLAFTRVANAPGLEDQVEDGHTYVAPTEGVRKDRHRGTEEADTIRPTASDGC